MAIPTVTAVQTLGSDGKPSGNWITASHLKRFWTTLANGDGHVHAECHCFGAGTHHLAVKQCASQIEVDALLVAVMAKCGYASRVHNAGE